MNINASQAAALADGFVDSLGTADKGGLQPRKTLTAFILVAADIVTQAQQNLNRSNTNASGKLSESLLIKEPVKRGSVVSIDIKMNYYGKFINKGVKGTKSGQGKYSFKRSNPSRKHVAAMLWGIRRAKKSTTNVNASKSVSRNEKKNASIAELDHAWGAARKVKMYGIKATGFIDKAVAKVRKDYASKLGKALKIDIINSI